MHRLPLLTGAALVFAALASAQTPPPQPKTPDPAQTRAVPVEQVAPSNQVPATGRVLSPEAPPSAQVRSPEEEPPTAPIPIPVPVVVPLPKPVPTTVPTSPQPRVFASEAGVILNPIKADQTANFEAVVQKLKDALRLSDNEVRRQQANGWKVYRATETSGDGTVYYLFVIDPVVKGADYTVTKVLYEAYPAQIDTLLKQFLGSYAGGQTLLNLTLVANLRLGAK